MSVNFRRYYVARPSVPPTSSTSGGTILIAHRRINKDGQRSEISPIRENVTLPATITPQTYSDTYALQRDEILASNDSGATWRIVPSSSTHIGALAVPAFSTGWPVTTLNSNQAANGFSINFNDFSPSSEPSQTFYLLNIGDSISSLTFNFLDLVTNGVAQEFAGLIEISLLGVFSALGNNPNLTFNQSLLWNLPQISLNTMSLLLPNLSFAKFEIKMVNFPLGDLQQQQFNLSLSVVSNRSSFSLTYPNQWPNGSFLIDEDTPFTLPIVAAPTLGFLTVSPFQFNNNGILRSNLFTRQIAVTPGAKQLVFSTDGTIRVEPSTYVLANGETLVASFTINGSSPFISSISYPWPIKPQSYLRLPPTTLLRARFLSATGYATTSAAVVGVSLYANNGLVATSGLCFIELGDTVSVGTILGATTDGRAIAAAGPLVALEAGSSGSIIEAGFVA